MVCQVQRHEWLEIKPCRDLFHEQTLLVRDLSIECWQREHVSVLVVPSLLFLLIWLGGYAGTLFLPRFGLLAVAHRQDKLWTDADGKRVLHPDSKHLHSVYSPFEVRSGLRGGSWRGRARSRPLGRARQ